MKCPFRFPKFLSFIIINLLCLSAVVGQTVINDATAKIVKPDSISPVNSPVKGNSDENEIAGTIYNIGSDDFNKGFNISPLELIQGRIPGLTISTIDGKPGNYNINNRRVLSFSSAASPLLVVDGIPVENMTVNPSDIESITFCGDGSGSVIFGERASDGVLMITTKKGTKELNVNYTGKFTISSLPKKIDVLSADEFRQLISERYAFDSTAINLLGDANTNWQDEIYRTAYGQDHQVSVSGSFKNIPIRFSAGKTVQEGILRTSKYARNSCSVSINPHLFDDHLEIGLNIRGNFDRNTLANEDAMRNAVRFDPTQPVFNGSIYGGYYTQEINNHPNIYALINPVALLDLTDNKENTDGWAGSLKLEYKLHFFPDLNIGFNYSRQKTDREYTSFTDTTASWTYSYGKGYKESTNSVLKNKFIDFYLNYSKKMDFLSGNIDLYLGYSSQKSEKEFSDYSSTLGNPLVVWRNSSNGSNSLLHSMFSRLRFSIFEKYILNLTLVRDSDSHFAEENKSAFSSNISLAWNLKNESFLKQIDFISGLKLFAGFTGIKSYPSINSAVVKYYFEPGGYTQIDPDLKHEKTSAFNSGIDFSILENRVSGSFTYYKSVRSDLMIFVPIPLGSGLSNYILTNAGKIENKGFEFSVNAKLINRNKLFCEVGTNISINNNKLISYGNDPDLLGIVTGQISGGVGSSIQIQSPGYPLNSFFVLQQVYDQQGNPIEKFYVDRSGEGGNISSNIKNYYHDHQAAPKILMGISSLIKYRQWEFSFSGRLSLGNYLYNNISSGDSYGNLYNYYSMYNLTSSINKTKFKTSQYFSDFYVENASFFRMDYLNLGYHFEDCWRNKISLYVFATAQNAFVLTRYSGQDPEVTGGIDKYLYPRARTFSIGLKLSI
jgi:TonB-dependent starch-binding outer membrane protein SusC